MFQVWGGVYFKIFWGNRHTVLLVYLQLAHSCYCCVVAVWPVCAYVEYYPFFIIQKCNNMGIPRNAAVDHQIHVSIARPHTCRQYLFVPMGGGVISAELQTN